MSHHNPIIIYKLTVRENHLDTFGHINNATYLEILEEARWQLITDRDYGLSHIHKTGQGPIILEVHLKFLKEIRLRENIKITTQLINYKGKIGQLDQKIYLEDDNLAAEAKFSFGLFDLNKRSLIEPTPQWKNAIGMSQ